MTLPYESSYLFYPNKRILDLRKYVISTRRGNIFYLRFLSIFSLIGNDHFHYWRIFWIQTQCCREPIARKSRLFYRQQSQRSYWKLMSIYQSSRVETVLLLSRSETFLLIYSNVKENDRLWLCRHFARTIKHGIVRSKCWIRHSSENRIYWKLTARTARGSPHDRNFHSITGAKKSPLGGCTKRIHY